MKHFPKYFSIILSAAILLSGCRAQSIGAANNPSEEQITEPAEVSLPESAGAKESEAPRFSVERDNIRFSLDDKPFGLNFEYKENRHSDGMGVFTGWLAGEFDEPISVVLQYEIETPDYAEWVAGMVAAEKNAGEFAIDYLDITQTDSGQSIIAISQYLYESEDNKVSYSLTANCGNGYCIYLYVNLDGSHNTPEALENTLALFRSLEWDVTDNSPETNLSQENVFTFEDIKFRLDIPENVDYVRDEYEIGQTVYKRAVQFVQQASFGNDNSVTMSYFECADGDTFDNYELVYLRDIEELSGGTMQVVDEIEPFSTTDPAQRAYKWSYRVDNWLFVAAYYLIDDTTWVFVDYLVGDESRKSALEKSLESFELLETPKNEYTVLDLTDSERPEVTSVKINCNADISNLYKVDYLHSEVVGLFGCPVEINGDINDGTLLEFTYDPSLLNGISPEGLIILHYNENDSWYDTIPSKLDSEHCAVSAVISEGGVYMLADAYEWYRAWGVNADEYAHDVLFRCGEITPNFSISIPDDVKFTPCGDYMKDSGEPNVREKDLVAGPSVLDLRRYDIVLIMKYMERMDEITYTENITAIKEICEEMPEYYMYEEYEDYTIFSSRIEGDPQLGITGSGSVWAMMKITDHSWVYICYTYVYDKIDEYEAQAISSIKSFRWE
ncbi:MAG: hypothetical protein ACI4KA_08990 [Oscillospiraceae bacterium]